MATIDLIVLGMLKKEPLSAYDLQKLVEYRNISKWVKISTPSIYKKVIQLEEKGYISSHIEREGKMPEKSVYSLTEKGKRQFEKLMLEISCKPINIFLDFNALDVKTDEQMFEFITLIANGLWQGRKWRKAFKTLFEEYPELVRSSYEHELRGQPWKAYCAICKKYEELAQSKCNEIVARFRQLTGIV